MIEGTLEAGVRFSTSICRPGSSLLKFWPEGMQCILQIFRLPCSLGRAYLDGQGAVLQLPDIQRQRIGRGLLTWRPVSAPSGRVLKHLPLAPVTAKLCTGHADFCYMGDHAAFQRLLGDFTKQLQKASNTQSAAAKAIKTSSAGPHIVAGLQLLMKLH